jgi:hypothetical protein
MKKRFLDSGFFKTNKNQESMSRLVVFMGFFPSTIVLLWIHTVPALAAYMSTYGLAYLGGKVTDALDKNK